MSIHSYIPSDTAEVRMVTSAKRKAKDLDIKSETDEREMAFDAAFSKLLLAQANAQRVRASAAHNDSHMSRALDSEGDAVWDVIRTAAVRRWQVHDKLTLLEDLLKEGGTTWADHREYFLLASARIDLDHLDQ
jgi:hypothetical protein